MSSHQYITAGKNGFKGVLYDELLELGFYRMQHLMFTCNDTVINDDGTIIPVFWLRTLVNNCGLNNSAKTILKKSAQFSISIQEAYIDEEIEKLYALYKKHVVFPISNSCNDYLHQEEFPEPFDSMMIQVRDKGQLIAAGYFDKGIKSIAGIMNIYHPGYKSYSLGKLLMLQKLKYSQLQKMEFYYTGYISTGSNRFDYKVFPDATAIEILLPVEHLWIPYSSVSKNFLKEYYSKFFL